MKNALFIHFLLLFSLLLGQNTKVPLQGGTPMKVVWKAGEVKDNQIIKQIKGLPYKHTHTYDILPNSKSRAYLVKGVWMKSTLFP